MPERRIPWQQVATELGGVLHVEGGLASTEFRLEATVSGVPIRVRGKSVPGGGIGTGTTEIRALAREPFGVQLTIYRDQLQSRALSFLRRDIEIGDPYFDQLWIINAKRAAHAQAFLGLEVRDLLNKVPAAQPFFRSTNPYSAPISYYDFDVRGRDSLAHTNNFEDSAERLILAVRATVALTQRPQTLLAQWRALATQLGGTLHFQKRWKFDGTTSIRFSALGSPVHVAPLMVRMGWRRDRLLTRVSCVCTDGLSRPSAAVRSDPEIEAFKDRTGPMRTATMRSGRLFVRSDAKRVIADMEGNVNDAEQIKDAARVVALLAQGDVSSTNPYR